MRHFCYQCCQEGFSSQASENPLVADITRDDVSVLIHVLCTSDFEHAQGYCSNSEDACECEAE